MKRLLLVVFLVLFGAAAFPPKAEANRVFVTQGRGGFYHGHRPYYPGYYRSVPYYPRYYYPGYFRPYYGYDFYPYYTVPVFATPNPYFYFNSPGFGIAITP